MKCDVVQCSTTRWTPAIALAALCAWRTCMAQVPLPDPDLDLIGNGAVLATLQQADGSLIIGGNFESINGVPRRNIARLLPDRTLDTTWNPSADSAVLTLSQGPGSMIYAGGYFHAIGGVPRPGLARLDAVTGSIDSSWTASVADGVVSIVVDADGSLLTIPFGSINRTVVRLSGVDGSELPWAPIFESADYLVLDGHGALYVARRQFEFDFFGVDLSRDDLQTRGSDRGVGSPVDG
jgi:hypothetical protein